MLLKISSLLAKIREKLDEKGQGMVEYALILAAVAIIAVVAIWGGGKATDTTPGTTGNDLRSAVTRAFSTAASKVDEAQGAANTGGTGGTGGGGTGGN